MIRIILLIFTAGSFFLSGTITAQVGIGTIVPESSAILELSSDHQGFLLPRLSLEQRGEIVSPATGLMIYNMDNSELEINTGTGNFPVWSILKGSESSTTINSVTEAGEISSASGTNELITGMTLSPGAGTFLVMFNAQYGFTAGTPVNTTQGVTDLTAAYDEIMGIAVTNSIHGPIFGNGEVLTPGVYDLPAASSLAATLTMDGGGDTNAVFIIRTGGALSTGAGTTVVLANGARARNIFWVSEGALSLAANTIMKGTLISHNAAVSAAAGSDIEGRMFSTTGAVTLGPGTISLPPGDSFIDMGVLSSFIIFSSAGALGNTGVSSMAGDIGTNAGAITGFEDLDGNIYFPGSPPPAVNSMATFCIYQNGMLVENSSRTTDANSSLITLQAMATVATGEPIEIMWKVDEGAVILNNRILTIIEN